MLRIVGQPRLRLIQLGFTVAVILSVSFLLDLYNMRQEVEYFYDKFENSKGELRENIASICAVKQGEAEAAEARDDQRRDLAEYMKNVTKPPAVPGKPQCIDLLEGDATSQQKAKLFTGFYPLHMPTLEDYTLQLQNCARFRAARGYHADPLSTEEAEFPIAYSIMIHKDFGQAERLLSNIYQPQNHYCFHVDAKADPKLSAIIRSLSRCLPNVFLVSQQESIVYASIKRLQAEINCMEDLLSRTWKYFINLTGQAFPLKTNRELVRILTFYNGANDIEGKAEWASNSEYLSKRWRVQWVVKSGQMEDTDIPKDPPPNNITIIKGSAYGVFSREFVEFALTDELAVKFLEWSRDTYSPDEFYWSSMHHKFINPMFHTPGGYSGVPERKPWLASYSAWHPIDKCYGEFIRSVCVFGVGDLPNLLSRKELFANKFYWNFEPLAVDCLEEWLKNKTLHNLPMDTTYYKDLPFLQKEFVFVPSKVPRKDIVINTTPRTKGGGPPALPVLAKSKGRPPSIATVPKIKNNHNVQNVDS